MREHHLQVARTARFVTLGDDPARAASLWYVLHGHGQLAAPFLKNFEGLDDGTRVIVAPEALNRFYAEPTSWHGAGQARVGATWMTREDRQAEITDYVRYLDTLHEHVGATMRVADAPVTVLGFSQGVATAARWVCRGRVRAGRVIFWAGTLPLELDAASAAPLRGAQLIRVLGDTDEMASAATVQAEEARERELGLAPERIRFAGGHRLDRDVLSAIAS